MCPLYFVSHILEKLEVNNLFLTLLLELHVFVKID